MNYRQLGKTGIQVSEIGFGAWGIGGATRDAKAYGPTNDQVSIDALKEAFEEGITFYDTAALYGYGHSEELIGTAFKDVRPNIILTTKVGYINFNGDQDFSRKNIRTSLENSLRRLQTDYIDLYQLHDPPISLLQRGNTIFHILEELKKEGKVRAIGISTKSSKESLIAIEQFDFQTVQINFNLVDQRAIETGLLAKCQAKGIGVIARTPLCFGFLTGKYSSKSNFDASDHRSKWSSEQIDRWASAYQLFVNHLMKEEEQTNTQIALRFCLSYPEISTVIPGMLTEEHVKENVISSQLGALPSFILEKFESIYQNHQFFI